MSPDVQYRPGDVINDHVLSADGTQWLPVSGQPENATADDSHQNWFVRHKVLTGLFGAGALFLVVGVIGSGSDDTVPAAQTETVSQGESDVGSTDGQGSSSDTSEPVEEPVVEEPAAKKPPVEEPEAKAAPATSLGQDNALRAAENYLDVMSFSKQGLIDQLSSEYGDGYSVDDATWAVSQLNVDWNEQAVGAAENYQEAMPFSRSGLIEQLSSEYGDQFTVAQATYAADALGL